MTGVLSVERHGEHVLLVTLNRPQSLNAMDSQLVREMHSFLTRLHAEPPSARCIVLTGAGQAFCAGGDLKERLHQSVEDWRATHEISEQSVRLRMESPVPWIAAVNGACIGGGLEMALSCDFIYADADAVFALAECGLGIIPGNMGTQNLPRAVGERRAKELILGARRFSAREAREWGLVNRVCEPGRVLAEALQAATGIAHNAPLAVSAAKRAIHDGLQLDLHAAFDCELRAYYPLLETQDRREGIAAFVEKRRPRFEGT